MHPDRAQVIVGDNVLIWDTTTKKPPLLPPRTLPFEAAAAVLIIMVRNDCGGQKAAEAAVGLAHVGAGDAHGG